MYLVMEEVKFLPKFTIHLSGTAWRPATNHSRASAPSTPVSISSPSPSYSQVGGTPNIVIRFKFTNLYS
jgi:hypothetical protein